MRSKDLCTLAMGMVGPALSKAWPALLSKKRHPPARVPSTRHMRSSSMVVVWRRRLLARAHASPLPIAAALNVHLIKAEPIDSINKRSAAAENKWRTQAVRASQRV